MEIEMSTGHPPDANQPGKNGATATCALCREMRLLVNSHLIPAAAFLHVRATHEKNPHPVFLSQSREQTTSKQAQKKLLCERCEGAFHKNGEDWVLRRVFKPNTGFEMLDMLQAASVFNEGKKGSLYDVRAIPGLDAQGRVKFRV